MAEKKYVEYNKVIGVLVDMETLALYEDVIPIIKDIRRLLESIPAADARPVVRGTWEESADQLQANCSACKTSFPCWRMWPANFCPNCGADMREES